MIYTVRPPYIFKSFYSKGLWRMDKKEKNIFLTFDDGPTPEITEFVLDTLKKFNAKATFFCIGKNVEKYPEIFNKIIVDGHSIGNHTQHHLNGWKNTNANYFKDVEDAQRVINSNLFRPPYGKIKLSQYRYLKSKYKIVFWDILSGDFDPKISAEQCLNNVLKNIRNGSIIVFHDSVKASEKLKAVLPKVIEFALKENYSLKAL